MADKQPKTFKQLGLVFTKKAKCVTCLNMSCHNNVPSTFNNRDYNVHISMNSAKTHFRIHASESANVESSYDIEANFNKELDAVAFVCKTFQWFRCA